MTKDTVVAFRTPDGFSPDPLTDLLRQGARDLIAQAVEAELSAFLGTHADQTDAAGRSRLVRHGHLPEREVQTGIGAVPVKVPRVRDRADCERLPDRQSEVTARKGRRKPGLTGGDGGLKRCEVRRGRAGAKQRCHEKCGSESRPHCRPSPENWISASSADWSAARAARKRDPGTIR